MPKTALLSRTIVILLGLQSACYPHTQAYRGAFSGKIVDPRGNAVSGATVVACTTEGSRSFDGCPHRAEAWSDLEGHFQFSPLKERQWCCFGESPLPPTHLTVCGHDALGRLLLASSIQVDASGATEPRILVAPQHDLSAQGACAEAK
jgi:hypothetical protein